MVSAIRGQWSEGEREQWGLVQSGRASWRRWHFQIGLEGCKNSIKWRGQVSEFGDRWEESIFRNQVSHCDSAENSCYIMCLKLLVHLNLPVGPGWSSPPQTGDLQRLVFYIYFLRFNEVLIEQKTYWLLIKNLKYITEKTKVTSDHVSRFLYSPQR